MTDRCTKGSKNTEESLLFSSTELTEHRNFVNRNLSRLIRLLVAEQHARERPIPVGCPHATPERIARKRRSTDGTHPCPSTSVILGSHQTGMCPCDDPLCDSDDPLDPVAAVILGSAEKKGIERYYDREWRRIIARLRAQVGVWEKIETLSLETLQSKLDEATNRTGVNSDRTQRLYHSLDQLSDHRYLKGELTLTDLPRIPYSNLQKFLTSLPGITKPDAWWLILTAFDKPVWPADERMDSLLTDLGILSPADLSQGKSTRHEKLENELTDRQIPEFHRAIAGHVLYGGTSYCDDACVLRKFSLSYRQKRQEERKNGPVAVDLFAGAGGLSQGFTQAGYEIRLAVDKNQTALDTYRLNHPEVPHENAECIDIEEFLEDERRLDRLAPEIDIVIGGPPCQSFSKAGYRARHASNDAYSVLGDPRTSLYEKYIQVIDRLQPEAVVMENVEGLIDEVGDKDIRVIDDVQQAFNDIDYTCYSETLDCSNFGLPQTRERVIVLAVQDELAPTAEILTSIFDELRDRSPKTNYTLKQGLANLPRIRRGEGGSVIAAQNSGRPSTYLQRYEINNGTRVTHNHRAREHPMEKDQELFDEVMQPGDTSWKVKFEKGRDDLIDYHVGSRDNPAFKDKYRMLHWDQPAPTVVAHLAKDANNFVIPDYFEHVENDPEKQDASRNRGITPREAARLQSFPDHYIFLGPFTDQFRQIGNAVPPALARQLATVAWERFQLQWDSNLSETPPLQKGIMSDD